jgi:peptide/nickel transport system ATP-binding protein
MSELRFEGVSVVNGRRRRAVRAVDGVDLVVPEGHVVGLVGESGSGKSTLARAAAGLVRTAGGRITLAGSALVGGPGHRSRQDLQVVFQDPYSSLDPRMTVGESLGEVCPRGTGRGPARRAEVSRLLDLVGLGEDCVHALPEELSGGQRQRVALARALAPRPRVVLADEITSALDVSVQGAVLNVVRDLNRRLGVGMLFISHNLAVVRYVSDSVAVMYAGRIVEQGPADRIFADPQHPYTRALLAAVPGGEAREAAVLPGTEPFDPHRPPPGCRFHPRCPIGPAALPERHGCRTRDPFDEASLREHRAACHYARTMVEGAGR